MLTPNLPIPTPAELHAALGERLDEPARAWLDRALRTAAAAAHDPDRGRSGPVPWELDFASAGRHCRHRNADTARVLLLHAARADAPTAERLYVHGTAAERRAVLCALPYLPVGAEAVPLVEDALRANDTRLLAAAVGPYAARHLDPHGWRHAVLKCLFTGVPVSAVADLARRAHGDAELARMLTDYARERTAAGRSVPDDLQHVLALTAAPPDPAPGPDPEPRPGAATGDPAPTPEES